MPEAEKDPKPQSTLQAMATGLSVAPERGMSALDRFGPLIAIIVYVACIFLLAFEVVPNPAGILGLMGLLGPFVGAWATRLGTKPAK